MLTSSTLSSGPGANTFLVLGIDGTLYPPPSPGCAILARCSLDLIVSGLLLSIALLLSFLGERVILEKDCNRVLVCNRLVIGLGCSPISSCCGAAARG